MKGLVAGLAAALLFASPAVAAPSKTGLPAAVTEDGCAAGVKRCVWDARHQGNGEGRSYILIRSGGDFRIKYVTHSRAHRLQARWCQQRSVNCDY